MMNNIVDVRAEMPNYDAYANWRDIEEVMGIAIHHSGWVNRWGISRDDAHTMFHFHVEGRGWEHGGYHYVILPDGTIQYALDERIAAYHAGIHDPEMAKELGDPSYWNKHYLAICLPGWFSNGRRTRLFGKRVWFVPNIFTQPSEAQYRALLALSRHLIRKYEIEAEHVCGHRELFGCQTECPGYNFDLDALRATLSG